MFHGGKMDDGELELPDHALVGNPSSPNNIQGSTSAAPSVHSYLNELLKNTTTCTHAHTCNPPGPDALHSHTCYHTHTQVLSSGEDDKSCSTTKPRRSLGNREAVRKYREKKKAHTAYLEEEVKKLRVLNQQLERKLLGRALLEAEVLRLRSLLFGIRGEIDGVLGTFPCQTRCNSTSIGFMEAAECEAQSNNSTAAKKLVFLWSKNRQPANVDCQAASENFISVTNQAELPTVLAFPMQESLFVY